MRQYQYILLFVHAVLHLCTDCSMKKDIAFIQLCVVFAFKHLFKRELKSKLELPYCDDSILKEKANELKEEKVN